MKLDESNKATHKIYFDSQKMKQAEDALLKI